MKKKAFTIREIPGASDPLDIIMQPLVDYINTRAGREVVKAKKDINKLTNNAQNKKIELGKEK